MKIFFRVDANNEIGMGHFMRCLTLAKEFQNDGHQVTFISFDLHEKARQLIPNKIELCEINNLHSFNFLPQKIEHKNSLVIVDHYQIDVAWHQKAKERNLALLVIDDLANSDILADFILNQNINASAESYRKLVKFDKTHFLIGPSYALLRKEFSTSQKKMKKKYDLLISMGGADGKNQTPRILKILDKINYKNKILILIGATSQNLNEVERQVENLQLNCEIKVNSTEVANDMRQSALCIGAGGTSCYERASLSIPTLVLGTADNQIPSTMEFEKRGIISYAGQWDKINDSTFLSKISSFLNDLTLHEQLRINSKEIIDGKGARRSLEKIMEKLSK